MSSIAHAFKFCPQCGAPIEEVGNSPLKCKSCQFTHYFSPATAVGGILINSQSEVLFLVRGKNPGKGKLGLPGGFVDSGETLEEALVREVIEETALEIEQFEYLCSFPNVYHYLGWSVDVTDTFFLCKVKSYERLSAQAGEVDGFKIARPTAEVLAQMAFESNRRAVQEVRIENLA